MMRRYKALSLVLLVLFWPFAASSNSGTPRYSDPPGRDAILDWNAIALQTVADDFSNIYGAPEQNGPTRTSRALAIIHLAMFDAANTIEPNARPYMAVHKPTILTTVSLDAAVAQAAVDTLTALYPRQAHVFALELDDYLSSLTNTTAVSNGIKIGHQIASDILTLRSQDGSNVVGVYTPSGKPGADNVDPLNPTQGYLDPAWGQVTMFSPSNTFVYFPLNPPALNSLAYTFAYDDVSQFGGDGIITPTNRTQEETEIGLFWGYDGSPKIGVPPRLYNQITRTIAIQEGNTEIENARLFGLVNAAMGDAAIVSWGTKYHYAYWRPILGIRAGNADGNPFTSGNPTWTPLGAQRSNTLNKCFTPNFPSYSSGHATFGGALFRTLQWFYGTDNIAFTFVSDELNGVTTNNLGQVRPYRPRQFRHLSAAATENARSRIYLGIHWQFDADEGLRSGAAIGDHVYNSILGELD